jgi:hypothetical protein
MIKRFATVLMAAALALACLPAQSSDTKIQLPSSDTSANVYRCRHQADKPPDCECLTCAVAPSVSEAKALDAVFVLKTSLPTSLTPGDPVVACVNSHGGSGCCRLVASGSDAGGAFDIIVCGNQ